jgi:hypothetical protein
VLQDIIGDIGVSTDFRMLHLDEVDLDEVGVVAMVEEVGVSAVLLRIKESFANSLKIKLCITFPAKAKKSSFSFLPLLNP